MQLIIESSHQEDGIVRASKNQAVYRLALASLDRTKFVASVVVVAVTATKSYFAGLNLIKLIL